MAKETFEHWLYRMDGMNVQEQRAFIYESLKPKEALHLFGQWFFPDVIPQQFEVPEFQIDIHNKLANLLTQTIIVPRGHGKTTWARIDILHDICYAHEDFLVLVASTMTDAQASFAFVKTQLEVNDRLIMVFGDLVPRIEVYRRRKWSDSHFETANGVICIARGAGKGRGLNIKGKRPKKIVVDDIENDEQVRSKMRRDKLMHWLMHVIIPSLDPKRGRMKMIGTVLHYDCLILKMYEKFGGIRRAAIEDDQGRASMTGTIIFPEVFTRELLDERRKDMGTFAFAQEYLNEPMSDENSDVKMDWIKRRAALGPLEKDGKPLWKFYSVLDPAISTKQTADESAIVTIAAKIKQYPDDDLKLVVVSAEHGQWGMTGTIQQSKRIYDRYVHEKFGCETVAFQEGLRQMLNSNGVPAMSVNPKSKDKRSRLMRVIGLIEFGNVEFLGSCEDLITQLVQFPNADRDDIVDAFVYCLELATVKSGGLMLVNL